MVAKSRRRARVPAGFRLAAGGPGAEIEVAGRVPPRPSAFAAVLIPILGALLTLAACQPTQEVHTTEASTASATEKPPQSQVSDRTITVGDIEPEEPVKKIKRFQPLADYLAESLAEFGVQEGRVAIARDIAEMGRFMREGTVDVYFDSAFPALAVQELSGSQVVLRRWKGTDPAYWSTYVALRDSGIEGVEDFVGKVVAFEEPHSTSGFILPAGTLIQRGLALEEVESPQAGPAPDVIRYFFAQDERNTFELVLQGWVAGGGVSNQDYEELPADVKQKIIAFDATITVPRQLVTVSRGLDPKVVGEIVDALMALEETEPGRELLESLKSTKRFDPLPEGSDETLSELRHLMELVADNAAAPQGQSETHEDPLYP